MPDPLPVTHPLRVAALPTRQPTRFDLAPDAPERIALARLLGISAVHSLRFKGEVRAVGQSDFVLEAQLTATVVQPCVVTVVPVTTRIDETVIRRYLSDYRPVQAEEAEMPEDETEEPLGAVIDPGIVMTEALALALPDYPRAPGAARDAALDGTQAGTIHAGPGVKPLSDADLRPFAGLGALASRLFGGTDTEDGDAVNSKPSAKPGVSGAKDAGRTPTDDASD